MSTVPFTPTQERISPTLSARLAPLLDRLRAPATPPTPDRQRPWRYEFKYLVPHMARRPLVADISPYVRPDANGDQQGCYTVRSIYLDSIDWRCFHEKAAGVPRRHKLRIRTYLGSPGHEPVKFEIKHHVFSRVSKDTATVDRATYESLLPALRQRRIAPAPVTQSSAALRWFFCQAHLQNLAPKIIVQFRRQAFAARHGSDVRVTLDDELKSGRARHLFDELPPSLPLLPPGVSVFEIKVKRALPTWLRRAIESYHLRLQSVSKYGAAAMAGPYGLDGESD